jgi:hypothetical protein
MTASGLKESMSRYSGCDYSIFFSAVVVTNPQRLFNDGHQKHRSHFPQRANRSQLFSPSTSTSKRALGKANHPRQLVESEWLR